jgi:transcriptional regulator with XRE-family HTH domain
MEADPSDALDLAAARLAVDVCALLGQAFEASGLRAKQLAERLGVSEGRVSQVLNGDGNIRVATLAKFLSAMGYRPVLAADSMARGGRVEARPSNPPSREPARPRGALVAH